MAVGVAAGMETNEVEKRECRIMSPHWLRVRWGERVMHAVNGETLTGV